MSRLERSFREDRALRNAAKAVVVADLEHIKESLSTKGVFSRVGSRIGDGAADVFETAKEQAEDHRGILAALIGAILLWLGRAPLLDLLGIGDADDDANDGERSAADNEEISSGDNS